MTQWRQPGTTIEGVFAIDGAPAVIVPLTVVFDQPDRISHYIAPGTRYLRRERPDGSPLDRVIPLDELRKLETRLGWHEWREHTLVVTDPVVAHAVRLRWDAAIWTFKGWYVNLQAPLTRTPDGFLTEDHFLDIWIRPDHTWQWKDEDELVLAVERGRVTAAAAGDIRREGERVIERLERRAFPFDGSLEGWRPDPAWGIPMLAARWAEE